MMRMIKALVVLTLPAVRTTTCGNAEFDQCGGTGFSGETCCPSFDKCEFVNQFFSQCQPKDLCLVPQFGQCGGMDHHQPPRPWTPANHHQTCCPPSFYCSYQSAFFSQCAYNTTANTTCAAAYGQCGGSGWSGKTCCIPGYSCTVRNQYYSGCEPVPVCTNARFGQCGGVDADGNPWTPTHSDCCPDGFECSFVSSYFSQCVMSNSSSVEEGEVDQAVKDKALNAYFKALK